MQESFTTLPGPLVRGGHSLGRHHFSICRVPFKCESLIPARFAEVAAPILKLCVLNWRWSMCKSWKTYLRAEPNDALVSDQLLGNKNSGPGVPHWIARYCTKASTGQTMWVVFPRYMVYPFLNWSLLAFFRVICTVVEELQLSTATSDNSRSVVGSKWSGDGVVNTLTRRSSK